MKNFDQIYKIVYKKCCGPLEKKRIKERNIKLIILATVMLPNIYYVLVSKTYNFYLFLLSFIIVVYILEPSKKYNDLFKKNVIKNFVKEYSKNLKYDQRRGVLESVYSAGEFEKFDRFKSEDGIYGVLDGNYKINMSEVLTERVYSDYDDYDSSYYTVFHGLFAQVDLDKVIKGKIKIKKNTIIKKSSNENRVQMDSSEFEKLYDVYATDEIIAMQLLTADIMQMFLDFKEQNKILAEMTIKRNKLYIRFHTGNLFEAKIFKSSLDYDTLQKYFNTINFTLEITEKMIKNIKETEI